MTSYADLPMVIKLLFPFFVHSKLMLVLFIPVLLITMPAGLQKDFVNMLFTSTLHLFFQDLSYIKRLL